MNSKTIPIAIVKPGCAAVRLEAEQPAIVDGAEICSIFRSNWNADRMPEHSSTERRSHLTIG